MKQPAFLPVVLLALGSLPAFAANIEEGQTRMVTGRVAALEANNRSLVVDVPHAKGPPAVGVTVAENAKLTREGKAVGLGELAAGETVTVTYTRKGDRLVATEVKAKAAKR